MPNKYNVRAKRLALDNLIRTRAWASFRDRFAESDTALRQAVVECRHQTMHRTLLHSLCDIPPDSSPPPPELIRLVASACPRALTLHEPGNERTPLHLAIYQNASLETIEALVEAVDNAESLKRADLLLAVDFKNQTPLLAAVRGGAPDVIVKYLVNGDEVGTSLLRTGLQRKNREHCGVPLKYVASRESIVVGNGLENPDDLLRFMLVRTYQAKMRQRFPFFYKKVEGYVDDDTCLLQATIFCSNLLSSKLASSILSFIIRNRLFHRDRLTSRKDYAGNLTLHIACLSDTPQDQILKLGERETDYGLNSEDCTLMQYLVNASSPPGPFLSRNYEDEIPLHCAIRRGNKNWSQLQLLIDACPSSLECRSSKGELPLHMAIKCGAPADTCITKLWNCYPDSASLADESTGLYPFQLAAIHGKKRHEKGKQKKKATKVVGLVDWDATSLSFFLLRQCPAVLASYLRNAE